MSALPAEDPVSPYRTQPGGGPRTVAQLRAALAAASPADREQFDQELGELSLDLEEFGALIRRWRHRLIMRTTPQIRAAVAAAADTSAPRWTSGQILADLPQEHDR
ncbi:hypothetical protein [Streptomyces tsukubensis]|uniref:hypothetical protein n=1 Tax=Streptomyces tsukubensis TaxID=83656 RepID=UPI00344DB97B